MPPSPSPRLSDARCPYHSDLNEAFLTTCILDLVRLFFVTFVLVRLLATNTARKRAIHIIEYYRLRNQPQIYRKVNPHDKKTILSILSSARQWQLSCRYCSHACFFKSRVPPNRSLANRDRRLAQREEA